MFSKSKYLRSSLFIAIVLLFSSSFYLSSFGSKTSAISLLNDQENLDYSEQTITIGDNSINSQLYTTDGSLSGFDVWGQPLRITTEKLERYEYDIFQDKNGIYHFVYIKEITTHGMGLAYSYSTNDSAIDWSLEEIIITIDAIITKPKIIVDDNDNIHIAYFSSREDHYRVNYLNKSSTSSIWSSEQVINTTRTHTPSELTFRKTNTTVHLGWIFSENGRTAQTWNSEIIFLSKTNNASDWIKTQNDFFNLTNPLRMNFKTLNNGSIILLCTAWAEDYKNNTILLTRSDDFGISWSDSLEIYEYSKKIGFLDLEPSIVTTNIHVVFITNSSPKRIFYFELLQNGTIIDTTYQISVQLADSYFAGIIENNQTKNLHLVYEEEQDERYNIYQRTRLVGNTTWEVAEQITSDDNSIDPILIQNRIDSSIIFSQLFYLSETSVLTKGYNTTENWQSDIELLKTSGYENGPSFVIDSDGTLHLVVEQIAALNREIHYLKKKINESWTTEGSLTDEWWSFAASPKIITDSHDNLHCIFVVEEEITHEDTLYYRTLNKGTNNWSNPLLVTTPTEEAIDYQLDFLIDSSNTLHIIWAESTGVYQNRLIYSSKSEMDTVFSSEIIIDNSDYMECITPDAVVDTLGNIHLVYGLLTRGTWTSTIEYRVKLFSGNWSTAEIIAATSENYLYKPILTINDFDNLEMIYQRKYDIGVSALAADIENWVKDSLIDPWEFVETIVEREYITEHNFYILPNGTQCFIFHSNIFVISGPIMVAVDSVHIMFQLADKSWTQRELIQPYPQESFEPQIQYDSNTNNLYLIVIDEYSDDTHIDLISGQVDTDSDMLGDFDEELFGTNKTNPDSDQDQLLDGYEITTSFTNPALNDTDWDWLSDGEELLVYLCNPLIIDTDFDTLSDGEEVLLYSTNPIRRDSDFDGIDDDVEIFVYGTDPTNEDTEGDHMPDLFEILNGLDPLVDDADEDADQDGLYNLGEYINGTDPNNPDSDSDDLTDGDEVLIWRTNPLAFDTDLDTISDSDEVLVYHTDPNSPDSDQDGFTDREEINAGTDPNDPRDNVFLRKVRTILLVTLIPIFSILVFFGIFEFRYRILTKRVSKEEMDELQEEEQKLSTLLEEKSSDENPEIEK